MPEIREFLEGAAARPGGEPDLDAVRRRARRRRVLRRGVLTASGGAVLAAVVIGALALVGGNDHSQRTVAGPSTTGSSVPGPNGGCPSELPFRPTSFPDGFDHQLRAGSGGQVTVSQDQTTEVVGKPRSDTWHYSGSRPGTFIDIIRGDPPLRFAPGTDEPITVLGQPGRIGPVEDGQAVMVALGSGRCDLYTVTGFGVSRSDFRRFVEGLELGSPISEAAPSQFAGQGRLAVSTASGLAIVDGTNVVHAPALPAVALSWSPDGKWVALLDEQENLRLFDLDENGRFAVDGRVLSFAWSPTDSRLAINARDGGLVVTTPGGPTSTIVGADSVVTSVAWSSDGTELAYTQASPPTNAGTALRTDRVYIRDLAAGKTTMVPFDPGSGNGIDLGPWWPDGNGLYLWVDPQHSASIAADGLTLEAVSLPDGRAADVATTLPTSRALALSPDGSQVAVMVGGSRFVNQSKHLEVCRTGTDQCTPVDQPDGTVSISPAWSGDGRSVVFVRGAASDNPAPSGWLPTTHVEILDVSSGTVHEVNGAPTDIADPAVSSDGRYIVFQHDTALWLLDRSDGSTHELVDGLDRPSTQWSGGPAFAWFTG